MIRGRAKEATFPHQANQAIHRPKNLTIHPTPIPVHPKSPIRARHAIPPHLAIQANRAPPATHPETLNPTVKIHLPSVV